MRNRRLLTVAMLCFSGAAQAQLVNGDFESSTSQTSTPLGWTNIGHDDGVIAYSVFGTPAYDGNYFYDFGGYGSPPGPVGDGIMQTVATDIGQAYTLTLGLSQENGAGSLGTQLTLTIGGSSFVYDLTSDASGPFKMPFATTTVSYIADSATTVIKFIETANFSGGNSDPLIDAVSFSRAVDGGVPEPTTWAMMLVGFGMMGAAVRFRRRRSSDLTRIPHG